MRARPRPVSSPGPRRSPRRVHESPMPPVCESDQPDNPPERPHGRRSRPVRLGACGFVLSGYRGDVVRGSIRRAVPAKGVDLMNGVRLRSLEIVSVLLLTGILGSFTGLARGDDSCATKRCQNPTAIQDMRDSIAAACDCAGASSAAKYMGCVKRTIRQAISAGWFSTACKGAVVKCEAVVGCGKGIRPFRTVQDIFSQSCALPSCHSTIARQGGLSLDSEDVSYASLVNRPVTATENAAPGALLVKPG